MTLLSWIYMGVVWAGIIALNVFCFYRIFAKTTKGDASTPPDTSKNQNPP